MQTNATELGTLGSYPRELVFVAPFPLTDESFAK